MENKFQVNSNSRANSNINNSSLKSFGKKFCSACGTVNDPSSTYCYKCGVELPAQIDTKLDTIGNPAGFWVRLGAFIIDAIFLAVVIIAITVIFSDASLSEVLSQWSDPDAPISWSEFLINLTIDVAYWTIAIGTWGKTVGKAMLRLKVVRVDGSKLTYKRSFARYWAYYISLLPLGLGFIAIALSSKKRGFHDFICDTKVLKLED